MKNKHSKKDNEGNYDIDGVSYCGKKTTRTAYGRALAGITGGSLDVRLVKHNKGRKTESIQNVIAASKA